MDVFSWIGMEDRKANIHLMECKLTLRSHRICAMTFGCALKVPQSVAKEGLSPLVLSTVDSELNLDTADDPLPSKVKFYASFCQLHYIIGEVLETFYISNGGLKNELTNANSAQSLLFDKIARLLNIESELSKWASNLHSFFKMPSETLDTTPSKLVTREANILRARLVSGLLSPSILMFVADNSATNSKLSICSTSPF